MKRLLPILALALLASACDTKGVFVPLDIGFNRMIHQKRVDAFETNSFFADDRAMRTPPAGTVPEETPAGSPMLTKGAEDGKYAPVIPVKVDQKLLARGRDRFTIYCAVCHGGDAGGESVVADKMQLIRPPSFHQPFIRAFPPGRLYQIIAEGYGMMPSYAPQLSIHDRWAVVAYVKALQLSQHAKVSDLPPDVRTAAEEHLR